MLSWILGVGEGGRTLAVDVTRDLQALVLV